MWTIRRGVSGGGETVPEGVTQAEKREMLRNQCDSQEADGDAGNAGMDGVQGSLTLTCITVHVME